MDGYCFSTDWTLLYQVKASHLLRENGRKIRFLSDQLHMHYSVVYKHLDLLRNTHNEFAHSWFHFCACLFPGKLTSGIVIILWNYCLYFKATDSVEDTINEFGMFPELRQMLMRARRGFTRQVRGPMDDRILNNMFLIWAACLDFLLLNCEKFL